MVRTLDSHPKAVPWVLGKSFYVVTGPQAYCDVRMDHVAGALHILLAKKEGRIWFDMKCLKLYQFKRITWWCLSLLESVMDSCLAICLEICHAGKFIKQIVDSRNLRWNDSLAFVGI